MAKRVFYLTKEEFRKTQDKNIEICIEGLTGDTFDIAFRYMNDYSGFQISTEVDSSERIIGYSVYTSDTPNSPPNYGEDLEEVVRFLHKPPRDENFDEILEINRGIYREFYRKKLKSPQ